VIALRDSRGDTVGLHHQRREACAELFGIGPRICLARRRADPSAQFRTQYSWRFQVHVIVSGVAFGFRRSI
jgi:hypothetical protein